MHDLQLSLVALVALVGVGLASGSRSPAAPALVGHQIGPEVARLEARVSAHPEDADALGDLVESYLAHAAPGLAQAALDRAPNEVREQPTIADARARALFELGFAEMALSVERSVLATCQTEKTCSRSLLGRAQRREAMLAEMVRVGLDDPKSDPNLALVAYRKSTREVTLDLR